MSEFDEIARLSGLGSIDDLAHVLPRADLHKSRIRICHFEFETGNRLDGSTGSVEVTKRSLPDVGVNLSCLDDRFMTGG